MKEIIRNRSIVERLDIKTFDVAREKVGTVKGGLGESDKQPK